MVAVAVGWQVYAIHEHPLDLRLIGLAEFLPLPLLALPAGHVADRLPRRLVFAASLALDGVVAALLLVVTLAGAQTLWPFLALAFASGVVAALGWPAARAIPPTLGALLGGIWLARRPIGANAGRTLLIVVGVFGAAYVVFGLSRSFPLSVAALVVAGFADMFSMNIRSMITGSSCCARPRKRRNARQGRSYLVRPMRTDTRLLALAAALVATGILASVALPRATALPGLMTTRGPWGANNGASLRPRLKAIGMPALRSEGTRLHTHEHLDIVVNRNGYAIPAGIGIDPRSRFIAPLHTHDYYGIIHVESPTIRRYTLGQFFDVWGLRFSTRCLGAYCTKGKRRVWVFVNGRRALGDPRAIALRQHQEIVVAYGTYASIPKPIPRGFPFPPGL